MNLRRVHVLHTARLIPTLAVATYLLAGCAPLHATRPIAIDVVDALTGERASGVTVTQHVITTKFERPLRATATSDARGSLTLDALVTSRSTLWWVGTAGPAYEGTAPHAVPDEFRRATRADGRTSFLAPAWPSMHLRIELPADFAGLVTEWPLLVDTDRRSGWMPPASVAGDAERVAVARASETGHIAYPTSFAGIAGYAYADDRVLTRNGAPLRIVRWDERYVPSEADPVEPLATRVWEIRNTIDAPVVPEPSTFSPAKVRMWFIGTFDELRRWMDDANVQQTARAADEPEPWSRTRWTSQGTLIERSRTSWNGAPTSPPAWTTSEAIRAIDESPRESTSR